MTRSLGTRTTVLFIATLCFTALSGARGQLGDERKSKVIEFTDQELAIIREMSPLPPVPRDETNAYADDPRAARFGQFLFFDRRLSANESVACSTCHDPARAFADGKPLAEGVDKGDRHTLALWNVAYNRWFFWDGRADTLWSQALRPIESPSELGISRLQLAHHLFGDSQLKKAYEAIFGTLPTLSQAGRFPPSGRPVSDDASSPEHLAWAAIQPSDQEDVNRVFVNVAKSIAAYERRLISRDSSFDQFANALKKNDSAGVQKYPANAQRGLKLFIGRGNCRLCHSGPNFSDSEFHDTRLRTSDGGPPRDAARYLGAEQVLRDEFSARGAYSDDRTGPAAEKLEFLDNGQQNWGLFKTPTLRNVSATAPYMHHGQLATLRDVVLHYSFLPGATESHHPERILVRLNLSDTEIEDLVAFLESLTDLTLNPALLRQPESP